MRIYSGHMFNCFEIQKIMPSLSPKYFRNVENVLDGTATTDLFVTGTPSSDPREEKIFRLPDLVFSLGF
jgi:hypothetical protein